MIEAAPAKINLCLHVTGLRADGYHLLDSVVVFADVADALSASAADGQSLTVLGPQAAGLGAGPDNLVLRAARLLAEDRGAALTLTKNLPLASGIGGGSADAAATLRLLSRLWQLPLPPEQAVLGLGADVPVCLNGKPVRMRGVGEQLLSLPPLPEAHLVLANPGVEVATPAVFRALARKDNAPLPTIPGFGSLSDFVAWLAAQRNDLEPPAIALAPVIAQVIAALAAQPGCLLARMSGSGATCFGLFGSAGAARKAEAALTRMQAGWWVKAGRMLGQDQLIRSTT